MSEEAATLIDAFDDAVVLTAMTDVMDRAEFKAAHDKWSVSRAALLAYIERLERERDEARTILAHTDIGSLPNDWTLKQVAEARIDDLMKLRDQVRDTCARAAKAEAENARLRPNAERYAWLRDWRIRRDGEQFEVRRFEEGLIGRPGKWYYPSGEILDAAIDAVRKP